MQNESPAKTKSAPKRGRPRQLVLGLVLLVVGALIIYGVLAARSDGPTATINNQTIQLDIADDPAEINLGLGGRESMPSDRGMLFVMPQPIIPNFWMEGMHFPLDFIWIDEQLKIVAITPSIGVESYPITFSPPAKVKYVLEVNAGLSAHHGWLPGDQVQLHLP